MMDKLTKRIDLGIIAFDIVCFSVLIVIVFGQVVARYCFKVTFAWIDELARYIFMWMMFTGISLGIHRKKHIGIAFLADHVPVKWRKTIVNLSTAGTIIFFACVLYYGAIFVGKTINLESPVLGFSLGAVYSIVPLTAALNIYYCLMRFIERQPTVEGGK